MTRAEKVARAQALRAQGLLLREIAAEMGAALSTVHAWLWDPDLSKLRARRDSYGGTCVDCGGPTDGSNGPGKAPTRCMDCRTWTRDAVLLAFREWADDNGGIPPTCTDIRRSGGRLPHQASVKRLFGSWNSALLAAGFDLVCDRRPETTEAMIAAVRAGEPIADIAERFGCTDRNISLRLLSAGTSVAAERPAGWRRPNRPLSEEAKREIVRLRGEGHTQQWIADRVGVTQSTVSKVLSQMAVAV